MPPELDNRDRRLAQLLDEYRQSGSSLRNPATLRDIAPEFADEVLRLAKTENDLATAVRDWKQAGDDTASYFPKGDRDTAPESPSRDAANLPERLSRYRIVRRLGIGGMGEVFAADDPQLQRQVAIKVPHFIGSREKLETAVARFLREARAMAAVEHANVCPIHDVGEHEGKPYVVMALIEGESLADRLKRGPALDVREAAGFE